MKQPLTLLSAACGMILGQAVMAADDPPSIQSRIETIQKQLDDLKREQETAKKSQIEQPKMTSNNGRFTIASADGRNTLAFRSFVQGDAGWYDQDRSFPLAADYRRGSVGTTPNRDNNGARDLNSGFYFRRARIGIEGLFNRDFGYKLIAEFGGAGTEGQGRINDAWISYTGLAPFVFQLGAFAQPANLDDGTSAEDLLLLERPTPAELSRTLGAADARLGFTVRAAGKRWMGSLSLTGRTIADTEPFDSQTAAVGRGGFLVLTSNDYNVHLGTSVTYVIHPADQGIDASGARYAIRLRDRAELRVDSTRLIDTGNIDAEHALLIGAELGATWKNFFVQAENYWLGVDRVAANVEDSSFGGYYAQASWAVTGETHRYNMSNAGFQAPRPSKPFSSAGGIGAFEIATRFSHMDLDSAPGALGFAPNASSIRGGIQDIWTLGVNWYATPNVRFMLDYQWVDIDRLNPAGPGNLAPFGATPATPPIGVEIGQSYNAIALRSQFSF